MKRFLLLLVAVFAVCSLSAGDKLIWKADFSKLVGKNTGTGAWYNKKNGVELNVTGTKNTMTINIVKNPKKGFLDIQGLTLYPGKYEKGVKYEASYKLKSNKPIKVWAAVAMSKAPWKAFKGEYIELEPNEVEDVDFDFVIPQTYDGRFRIVFLGLGNADDGTVIEISDLKLEKDID